MTKKINSNNCIKYIVTILALFITLTLAGCSLFGIRIDTSAWTYHSFEELGLSLKLPEDTAEAEKHAGEAFFAQNEEVSLSISEYDLLFPDLESLEAGVAAETGAETEILTVNDAQLVHVIPAEESTETEYFAQGPAGDTYRILLSAFNEEEMKHAKAVASAINDTLCSSSGLSDAEPVKHSFGAPGSGMDYLVLVNSRNRFDESKLPGISLVRTLNSQGEEISAERTALKEFFGLQKALNEEGIRIDIAKGFDKSDALEHCTGLALDLYLIVDDAAVTDETELAKQTDVWEKVQAGLADNGFILRYPEGSEYYTDHEYTPWNIRYTGTKAAKKIAKKGITLEEYLGADPAAIDYLVLVNKEHPVPDGWEDKVQLVTMTNRHGEKHQMERITYNAYLKLKNALKKEGVYTDVNTAYRSVSDQVELKAEFLEKYGADYVKKYVAEPEYSEHHTGLAIDLYLESMAAWSKIEELAPEYGFILRYPSGKEKVTGYGYEPWHIRYVGKAAAKEITEKGLALEEYHN